MAVSTVRLNNQVLMTVNDTTAVAADVASGKAFYGADGVKTTGSASNTVYEDNDVIFMDYDGEIVYSCSATEALAMTELPANPSHTGLTAQGWNYTLAEMKAEVNDHGFCDIGQSYVTSDGKTRLYVTMTAPNLNPTLGLTVNGSVSVDWGDNTTADTMTGSSLSTVIYQAHTYASAGSYVITITVSSGSFRIQGSATAPDGCRLFVKSSTAVGNNSRQYMSAIRRIELGSNVQIGAYGLNTLFNLESVSIPIGGLVENANYLIQNSVYSLKAVVVPSGYTTFGRAGITAISGLLRISLPASVTSWGQANSGCSALTRFSFPSGCTSISSLFQNCYSLTRVNIPSGVTSIPGNSFYTNYSLSSLTIPSTVTSIGTYAFYRCWGMKEYHFKSTSVPSLANVNAFDGIPSDCIIYVPSAKLNDYKTADNWSTYADYMVGE